MTDDNRKPLTPEELAAANAAEEIAKQKRAEHSTSDPPSPLDGIAKPTFYPCERGCGTETMTPGVCGNCEAKDKAALRSRDVTEESIPAEMRWARFEAPELIERVKVRTAIDRGREAVGCTRVLINGKSAQGKTSLAVAMMRAWVQQYASAGLYLYAPDLQSARMRTRLGSEADTVLEAMRAPLLLLDDVGAGDLRAGPMEEVVHKRHHAGKATWVTTWMTSQRMGERFGGGLARRIFEGARKIELGGAT